MLTLDSNRAKLFDPVTTPSLLNWARLEALPVATELETGLQARLADPLWLLGRQWQFNEFQGEDVGMPVAAQAELDPATLDRIKLGRHSQKTTVLETRLRPLEVVVEAEPIIQLGPTPEVHLNWRDSAEAGLQCLRRLHGHGLGGIATALRAAYPLAKVAIDGERDPTGARWMALLAGKALDGSELARDLLQLRQSDGALPTLGSLPWRSAAAPQLADVLACLKNWLDELIETYDSGTPGEDAWDPERLEYAFAVRGRFAGNPPATLVADSYSDGHLEWHSFAVGSATHFDDPVPGTPLSLLRAPWTLPTAVRFPGMAADRYWEFEDSVVAFGQAGGGLTELMRLLLTEYALVYGNDWFSIPVRIAVGTLLRPVRLRVVDTFGSETTLSPKQPLTADAWRYMELTPPPSGALGPYTLLAPSLAGRLQGAPLEEVALVRDEMANLAWGVERRVASAVSGSRDRSMETDEDVLNQIVTGGAPSADIYYRLQTDVPDRWIPLMPIALAGQEANWLTRQVLIKTHADGVSRPIHPAGKILRTDPTKDPAGEPALRVANEEIPREGLIIRRTYQYARWIDGRSHLWIGRERLSGQGEANSGLRFDTLIPKP